MKQVFITFDEDVDVLQEDINDIIKTNNWAVSDIKYTVEPPTKNCETTFYHVMVIYEI